MPQQYDFLAQFIFQLGPVQAEGIFKPVEYFIAEKQAVMMLHVEQFDGKHVGRMFQFVAGHHQRRRIFLAAPPLHYGGDCRQAGKRTLAQDAKQVQVGEVGLIFSGRG